MFIDDEFVVTALLRFDVASPTASAIRDVLPLETSLMHVTCSGEGVFFYGGDAELEWRLWEHEAGVADLLAAYEAVEVPYFAAVGRFHTCCSAARRLGLVRAGTDS